MENEINITTSWITALECQKDKDGLLFSSLFPGLVLWQAYTFLNTHTKYSIRLGLVDNTKLGLARARDLPVTMTLSLPRETFEYLVHAAFLTLFGATCMHIQVMQWTITPSIWSVLALSGQHKTGLDQDQGSSGDNNMLSSLRNVWVSRSLCVPQGLCHFRFGVLTDL